MGFISEGKDFIGLMDLFDDIFCAVCMRITDKDLPEILILHKGDDMGDPAFVQLVKDIVQEQDRGSAHQVFQQVELGKFQGDEVRFLLTLAPEFLDGKAADLKIEIVLVYPHAGVLQGPVPLKVLLQQVF